MDEEQKILRREILLSFWKVHILHHAAEGPVVGQWMLEELRHHGYEISPGTLYPLLSRMERRGWLRCVRDRKRGPRGPKKYFLTSSGKRVLRTLRQQVRELGREISQ